MNIHRVLTFGYVNYILKKMNVTYLFFICALFFVDVTSECDHYIDCFTEFLHEFFRNNATDNKNLEIDSVHQKYFDLDEDNGDFDTVIKELTSLIKNVDINIKESEIKKDENNSTKIHVKVFEFNNASEKDSTPLRKITETAKDVTASTTEEDLNEQTTDSINFQEILMDAANMLPFQTTSRSVDIIPLQNDRDNEIFNKEDFYDDFDDNSTDYPAIDYIDFYKDTTNENVEYITTESPISLGDAIKEKENDIDNIIEESLELIQDEVLKNLLKNITNNTIESCNGGKMTLSKAVFPWIATIYLKNETNENQFEYFCDGALMADRVVLTAARCVFNGSTIINPENFLIILGKTSLQVSSGDENILRVKTVKPHENFTITDGNYANDLGMLVLESSVTFNDGISTACLDDSSTDDEEKNREAVTTAWSFSGDLTLIYFDKEKSKACGLENKVENTFCASYGNDVALCPSYGGLYLTLSADKHLFLQGLRTGNPRERGICYSKDVTYTSLRNYNEWIQDNVKINK